MLTLTAKTDGSAQGLRAQRQFHGRNDLHGLRLHIKFSPVNLSGEGL